MKNSYFTILKINYIALKKYFFISLFSLAIFIVFAFILWLNIQAIENTYCFADAINDLEMLKHVSHPIIMANADEKLKNYGFEMTDDVLDDGLYNYLVYNKLIKTL